MTRVVLHETRRVRRYYRRLLSTYYFFYSTIIAPSNLIRHSRRLTPNYKVITRGGPRGSRVTPVNIQYRTVTFIRPGSGRETVYRKSSWGVFDNIVMKLRCTLRIQLETIFFSFIRRQGKTIVTEYQLIIEPCVT